MTLKDQIARDIDNVFLNLDEFAFTIVLNGITLNCVPDDDRLLELSSQAPGVYLGEHLVFVNASDLPGKPAINMRAEIDGKPWFVVRVLDEMGMYAIFLGANQT